MLDLNELYEIFTPPTIPQKVLVKENIELSRIVDWDKFFAMAIVSGLLTHPEYDANGVRLDWLLRLFLSNSEGEHKPDFRDLEIVLNVGLSKAFITNQEDPNEDLFCDLIGTKYGNYRILTGKWTNATPYTQTLIEAYEALPEIDSKNETLDAVYALLKISEEIALRANIDRNSQSGGRPSQEISLPDDSKLNELTKHIRISNNCLSRLGIKRRDLERFNLQSNQFSSVCEFEFGNSPLDFQPIHLLHDEVFVIAPNNISIALRGLLINSAITAGKSEELQLSLMQRQEFHANATNFWPVLFLDLSPPIKYGLRCSEFKYDRGVHLQILQIPIVFDNFQKNGFNVNFMEELSPKTERLIVRLIESFWTFLEGKSDYRESVTVILAGGFGATNIVGLPIDYQMAPDGWQLIHLNFADIAILGAHENFKFRDIVRLSKQIDILENAGFRFGNPFGFLNFCNWSRMTDGSIISDDWTDITPPSTISMSPDGLQEFKAEGIFGRDFRTLEIPEKHYRPVQRFSWREDNLKPIYVDLDRVDGNELIGAVFIEGRTWWIESNPHKTDNPQVCRAIWNSVLEWLSKIGPDLIERFPSVFPAQPKRIVLQISVLPAPDQIVDEQKTIPLDETITCLGRDDNSERIVVIREEWFHYLRDPQNIAEVQMIASILEVMQDSWSDAEANERIRATISEIVGNTDWRWIHAVEPIEPNEYLLGNQNIKQFHKIPPSVFSLVKCGFAWKFYDRSLSSEIIGSDACRKFLFAAKQYVLESLITDIRKFNRRSLTFQAADDFLAAVKELKQWSRSIRAVRAIEGLNADKEALNRRNEIFQVMRSAKAILEVGVCEASEEEPLEPNDSDMQEMYVKVILLMDNSQLFAAIRGGLIPAELRLSPTGDILSNRESHKKLFEPGISWFNIKKMDEASEKYIDKSMSEHRDSSEPDSNYWDLNLRNVVEEEYRISVEIITNVTSVLMEIAEQYKSNFFATTHLELARMLSVGFNVSSDGLVDFLDRLTLRRRNTWTSDVSDSDIDIGRFDRPLSLINRPLLMLDDNQANPTVLVVPTLVSNALVYSISGLKEGRLNNEYWQTSAAKKYAGSQGNISGSNFEKKVEDRLKELGLTIYPRCKLSKILNQKVPDEFGDIDIFAITPDKSRVWVIEVKNLRLCRSIGEVASRLSDYRGQLSAGSNGKQKPDKLLRHIERTRFIRDHASKLQKNFCLPLVPEVKSLLLVDSPQPMNFHFLEDLPDAKCIFFDEIDRYDF